MLVLSRMKDEKLLIGGGDSGFPEVEVIVVDIRGDKVRLGISAPDEVPIHRKEVADAIEAERKKGKR